MGTVGVNISTDIIEWSEEFYQGIEVLKWQKPKEKSILKAAEELSELLGKLLQFINKPESIKEGDIEEEIVDCEMHFIMLNHYFPISNEIRERKIKKFLNSKDYLLYLEKSKAK